MTRRSIPSRVLVAATLVALALPGVASADHGGTGEQPVTAADRTSLELLAEGYMHRAHDRQRAAGDTRNGVTFSDVGAVGPLEPWTDVLTVSRAWADRTGFGFFEHNPDYPQQYGHWRGVGENLAIRTIRPATSSLTRDEVLAAAEQLMQGWWESEGHRRTWMRASYDHFAVGVDIHRDDVFAPQDPRDYWVMMAVANFRDHDGSLIRGGEAFAADGSTPLNESDHVPYRPTPTPRDVSGTCDGSGSSFDDVPPGGVFEPAIRCLVQYDVTRGVGDGRYDPSGDVTVGELAAFLRRSVDAAGGDASAGAACSVDGQFTDDLSWAVANQVLPADGCERGAEVADRGLMAQMVVATLRTGDVTVPRAPTDWFHDDEGVASERQHDVLAELGIVVGSGRGFYEPDASITRGQMAAFLAGTIDALRRN